jgi:hypothetical protein
MPRTISARIERPMHECIEEGTTYQAQVIPGVRLAGCEGARLTAHGSAHSFSEDRPMERNQGVTDWTGEERYWREKLSSRPYARSDRDFDYYAPAYRYGTESADRYRGRQWSEVETDLERGWNQFKGQSKATWQDVKDAVRDAWDRVTGRGREAGRADVGKAPPAP